MKIRSLSAFKDPLAARKFFKSWVTKVSTLNDTVYDWLELDSSLGKTTVWGINACRTELETIVIFPGFRTSSLFWDLDNALAPLKEKYRIFLVETNGQPVLSEGKTPDIRTDGYGIWAEEILKALFIERAVIAGASFGGLVCLKLCITAPHLVEKAILLNPGCLQPFSLSLKNLYYNLLPLIAPSKRNIEKFLDKAVFYKKKHKVSNEAKKLVIEYEHFAITQFMDKAQKPYAMSKEELSKVKTEVYLILGDKDILFPYKKSIKAARKSIGSLREIRIIRNTGHGIETSKQAIVTLMEFSKKNAISA